MNALTISAAIVGRTYTLEAVAILSVVKGVREVRVTRGQTTIENLTTDQVVLAVILAVAPSQRTVSSLLEAHEITRLPRIFSVTNFLIKQPPTKFTLRIDNANIGIDAPLPI